MNKRNSIAILGILGIIAIGYLLISNRQIITFGNKSDSGVLTSSITPPVSVTAYPQISSSEKEMVNVYFVALEDNGQTGIKIGCNDSLVPVKREVSTQDVLKNTLAFLLAYQQQYYGESSLYNSLYQSHLQIQEITIQDSIATVKLTGQVQLGGTCDTPRFVEQLKATILQFNHITSTEILINNSPLEDVVTQQ